MQQEYRKKSLLNNEYSILFSVFIEIQLFVHPLLLLDIK